MLKNIRSIVVKNFNIIILKLKKILSKIQIYYYYYNLDYRMAHILKRLMRLYRLYRLIHGLIALISYIKVQCPDILFFF